MLAFCKLVHFARWWNQLGEDLLMRLPLLVSNSLRLYYAIGVLCAELAGCGIISSLGTTVVF